MYPAVQTALHKRKGEKMTTLLRLIPGKEIESEDPDKDVIASSSSSQTCAVKDNIAALVFSKGLQGNDGDDDNDNASGNDTGLYVAIPLNAFMDLVVDSDFGKRLSTSLLQK